MVRYQAARGKKQSEGLTRHCWSPSLLFIIFESIINFAMIIEVSVRLLAMRRVRMRNLRKEFRAGKTDIATFRHTGDPSGTWSILYSLRYASLRLSSLHLAVQRVNAMKPSLTRYSLSFVTVSSFSVYSWWSESKQDNSSTCVYVWFTRDGRNKHSMNTRSARVDFSDIPENGRDPSVEFSALDRHREFDDSFLTDSEEDEH